MYIVLDRMFECKVTKKELKDVLNRFLRLGWLHVDVHPGNVMCNKKGNICLIDLGWLCARMSNHTKVILLESVLSKC